MVLDGPNVDSKVRKAARRASGMVWGSRSKGLSQKMLGCYKRPSAPLLIRIVPFWKTGRRTGVSLLNISFGIFFYFFVLPFSRVRGGRAGAGGPGNARWIFLLKKLTVAAVISRMHRPIATFCDSSSLDTFSNMSTHHSVIFKTPPSLTSQKWSIKSAIICNQRALASMQRGHRP